LKTVIAELLESIVEGNSHPIENISSSLEIVKTAKFKVFALIVFLLTAIFTYLVSKVTLKPVKNSLSSQKRFIADIAHELRTPLAIIKTNGEVELLDKGLDPKIRKMIESNVEELDRMSGIINNLLTINNLVKPDKIKFRLVDMAEIIDSVIDKMRVLASKKEIEITVIKESPHIVWGNPAAIEQIFTNILKNAVDYSGRNSKISFSVGPDYFGNIVVKVKDEGIGIAEKDLPHIFEPFYRAEYSRARTTGSSGLGLTIVSELVKMHSGRITIKSAEKKGTEVVVTLPYNKNVGIEQRTEEKGSSEITVNFLR